MFQYTPLLINQFPFRCFEIDGQFPKDHTLTVQVWDYDATSSDDLIGETRIDIENRYYSNHRGHCGISRTWCKSGYNAWRDRERPTQIVETLCRRNNLPLPEYTDTVTIGKQKFACTGLESLDESGCVYLFYFVWSCLELFRVRLRHDQILKVTSTFHTNSS